MLPVLSRISRTRALQGAAVLVVLGLLLWWLLPIGPPAPSGSIVFSTGAKSGVYQRYGLMLKDDLARDLPDVSVELQNSVGSEQNIERVASGRADFTIATADAVAKYLEDGKPGASRLRGCARLYDDYVQLIVPAGSKVRDPAGLRGMTVGVGPEGSGVRLVAERLLDAAGLDPAVDVKADGRGINDMPRLLRQGRIDAFFWSGGLPTDAVAQLSESFGIRLVPLGPSLVAGLHATGRSASRYYRPAEIPADAYRAARNGVSVPTVAVANLLVTTDLADPALTEAFTRTVIKSRDRIGRELHPAQLVDLRTAIYTDPLPLHEGAKRYYRSVKP